MSSGLRDSGEYVASPGFLVSEDLKRLGLQLGFRVLDLFRVLLHSPHVLMDYRYIHVHLQHLLMCE